MRKMVVCAVIAMLVIGCGDDDGGGTTAQNTTTEQPDAVASAPERTRDEDTQPASPQDRSLQGQLERHLRDEAATRARREWGFDDIRDIRVTGRRVIVATRLAGSRGREQAGSLCFSTREFFLAGGQTQTPYDVFVTDGRATLAAC